MRIYGLTLGIFAIYATGFAFGFEAKQPNAHQPNIVFIVADDLGWGDVGWHDSEIRTPHLDALANRGAKLEAHYVQPVCTPTRAALMTGRYPIRHGLQTGVVRPWAQYGLPLEEQTLAEGLKSAGYATASLVNGILGISSPSTYRRGAALTINMATTMEPSITTPTFVTVDLTGIKMM